MDSFHRVFEKILQFKDVLASRDFMTSLLCGGLAGMLAKTVIAPAERVKISFQISREKFTLSSAISRGKEIVRREGFLNLWKGHSTNIIRIAPYAGLSYGVHDYAENVFKAQLNADTLPSIHKFLAGSIGGAVATLITYPLDCLRVRLAFIPSATWISAIRQGGLFHGIAPTMIGIVPYSGTAWWAKQSLAEAFPKVTHRSPNTLEALVLNALAGLCGQFVTYPLDIVRRRMQMSIANKNPQQQETIIASLRALYNAEGIRGLFKGFSLNVIKGPISFSISLTTFDLLKSWIQKREDEKVLLT